MIDDKDVLILLALIKDARTPVSALAQETGLSVSSTAQRIAKLEERQIIRRYKLVLNHRAFPYDEFDIYYTLTNVSASTIKQAMKHLSDCPYTTQVLATTGYCDIRITVLAKNMQHLQEILGDVEHNFSAHIQSREILAVTRKYKSKAESFLSALFQRRVSFPKRALTEIYSKAHAALDQTNVQLIKALAKDPRASYASLAAQVKRTPEAVASRVKNLEKKNIINSYTTLLNGQLLGYQWAILLLNMRHGSEKEANEIRSYVQSHANVSSAVETVGRFTMSITLFGQTLQGIRDTELDFRSRFGESIMDASMLFILDNEKYPELPEGILQVTA